VPSLPRRVGTESIGSRATQAVLTPAAALGDTLTDRSRNVDVDNSARKLGNDFAPKLGREDNDKSTLLSHPSGSVRFEEGHTMRGDVSCPQAREILSQGSEPCNLSL